MSITPPTPDDPFGGLTASGRVTPEVAASAPYEPAPEPGTGGGLPDDTRRSERWPVPLLVVLTLVGIGFGFAGTEAPEAPGTVVTIGGGTVEVDAAEPDVAVPAAPAAPEPARPNDTAKGGVGDGGSFWKPANLKAALASMRAKAGGAERITSLRVDTDYLVAEYARGKQRIYVYANVDGRVDRMNTRIGNPDDRAIGTGRVDPTAPDRIRRRIARLAGAKPDDVDYLVLSLAFDGESQWIGFLTQEADYDVQLNPFFARLDGSGVRANGAKAKR